MNILVLIKQTFDTEEKISLRNGKISEEGVEFIINPYDEYAVEEAVKLRDEFGGEVNVISVGPDRAESALRTAIAMGADKGIIVSEELLPNDEYTVSKVLAAVIQNHSYDLILAGNMSVDNGAGQVAIRVAEELGVAQITSVTKLTIEGKKVEAVRDVEGNAEVIESALPLLITCQQGLNEPRYPSLPGIMKAKKKPLQHVSAAELGLSPDALKARTVVCQHSLPSQKKAGILLQGEAKEQVRNLVKHLREEAKVI